MKYLLYIFITTLLAVFIYLIVASTYKFAVAIRNNQIARQENLKRNIGREDSEIAERNKKPFYIFIEYTNGDSETVADDNTVIYFETQNKALSWLKNKLIQSMSTYKLTQQIRELLPQVCEKNNIEQIEVESDYYWFEEFKENISLYHLLHHENQNSFAVLFPAIQEPQLRQILVGLQEVLGENPDYSEYNRLLKYHKKPLSTFGHSLETQKQSIACLNVFKIAQEPLITQAEALCNRWLDSLTPMFDTNPAGVLEELITVLEGLL